jgi:hypothetical protein
MFAVGHNPEPLPPVRGVHGASWNIKNRPDFVTLSFHLSKYSVEPHVLDSKRVLE